MNPGSTEAIEKGCKCDPANNHYGRGLKMPGKEPLFWKDEHCPLHGFEAELKKSKKDKINTK